METLNLIHGNCLEKMRDIPSGSVDMICTDLPYGMTACKWDTVIPFEPLWDAYKRIVKPNGAIVLFGSQPFTSALVMSNPKMFRYEWIWNKVVPTGFLNAKIIPMKIHENILVFYASNPTYNPQKYYKGKGMHRNGTNYTKQEILVREGIYGSLKNGSNIRSEYAFPNSIIIASKGNGHTTKKNVHPTQKPVALLEYLIQTYTNAGETVLDSCMGSGTTGVACINTSRNFIGIERDEHYFNLSSERIRHTSAGLFALPIEALI